MSHKFKNPLLTLSSIDLSTKFTCKLIDFACTSLIILLCHLCSCCSDSVSIS